MNVDRKSSGRVDAGWWARGLRRACEKCSRVHGRRIRVAVILSGLLLTGAVLVADRVSAAEPAPLRHPSASSGAAIARAPSVPEEVPALGESQIGFLDWLRASRRSAVALADDRKFRDTVRDAIRRHPDLLGAIAAQVGARGFTDEARAVLSPQVVGQTEGGWRSYDPNRLLGVPERRYSSGGFALSLRQLLYDFGAADSAVRSAEARESIAAARAEARRAELALRAVQVAVELDGARLQGTLASENEVARGTIARYVRERHELGGGSLGDVLRAQARVADAQAAVVSARTRIETAAAGYREIFGNEPPDAAGPLAPVDVPGIGAIAGLVPGFPTVRAASAARDAAQAELRTVASRAMPQLNFEGTFSRRDLIGDGWPGNDATALLNLRYEFYSGGAAQAREIQARSRVEQTETDYQSTVLAFERFAAQVLAEARTVEQLLSARIEAVELAASSLRAVREQFAFRRGTLLDLLNAQEVLQAAGGDLIDAYVQRIFNGYRLLYIGSKIDTHFGLGN